MVFGGKDDSASALAPYNGKNNRANTSGLVNIKDSSRYQAKNLRTLHWSLFITQSLILLENFQSLKDPLQKIIGNHLYDSHSSRCNKNHSIEVLYRCHPFLMEPSAARFQRYPPHAPALQDHRALTDTAPAALGSEITEQRHQKFKPVTLCLKLGHTGCPFFVIPFFLNVFLPNLNPLSGF